MKLKNYSIYIMVLVCITFITVPGFSLNTPKQGHGAAIGAINIVFKSMQRIDAQGQRAHGKVVLHIQHTETGKNHLVKSDDTGFFTMLNLKPGIYSFYKYTYYHPAVYDQRIDHELSRPVHFEITADEVTMLPTTIASVVTPDTSMLDQTLFFTEKHIYENERLYTLFNEWDTKNMWSTLSVKSANNKAYSFVLLKWL